MNSCRQASPTACAACWLTASRTAGRMARPSNPGGASRGSRLPEKVFGWCNFEVLAFECGTPATPVNAIPPRAWARCQLRFVVGVDPAEIGPALRRHLDRQGLPMVQVTILRNELANATRLDPDHPWVHFAVGSIERTLGRKPAILPNLGGGIAQRHLRRGPRPAHGLGAPLLPRLLPARAQRARAGPHRARGTGHDGRALLGSRRGQGQNSGLGRSVSGQDSGLGGSSPSKGPGLGGNTPVPPFPNTRPAPLSLDATALVSCNQPVIWRRPKRCGGPGMTAREDAAVGGQHGEQHEQASDCPRWHRPSRHRHVGQGAYRGLGRYDRNGRHLRHQSAAPSPRTRHDGGGTGACLYRRGPDVRRGAAPARHRDDARPHP